MMPSSIPWLKSMNWKDLPIRVAVCYTTITHIGHNLRSIKVIDDDQQFKKGLTLADKNAMSELLGKCGANWT